MLKPLLHCTLSVLNFLFESPTSTSLSLLVALLCLYQSLTCALSSTLHVVQPVAALFSASTTLRFVCSELPIQVAHKYQFTTPFVPNFLFSSELPIQVSNEYFLVKPLSCALYVLYYSSEVRLALSSQVLYYLFQLYCTAASLLHLWQSVPNFLFELPPATRSTSSSSHQVGLCLSLNFVSKSPSSSTIHSSIL
jgi:hypothetical protein